MGGDEAEDQDQTSTVEELGSVGDWRMPSWLPHSGVAWVFIGLAILSLVAHFPMVVSAYGLAVSIHPDVLTGAVAASLPIVFPAAMLWRAGPGRPRLAGRLALGSVAIGVGAFLDSVFSVQVPSWEAGFGTGAYVWDVFISSEFGVIWIVAAVLALAGPVLLANAIRGLRDGLAPRPAIRSGVVIGSLAVAYLVFSATFADTFFYRFVADPYPDGLFFYGQSPTLPAMGSISFITWAYFARAIISATGAGARPRIAWRMTVVAVLIQQGLLAVPLMAGVVALIASPSGEPNLISDLAVAVYRAATAATPMLMIGLWALLLAAFAAGLGNPAAAEPAAPRIELDALPNPG